MSLRPPASLLIVCCLAAPMACARPAARAVAPGAAAEQSPGLGRPERVELTVKITPRPEPKDPRVDWEVRATAAGLPSRFVVQKRWAGDEEVLAHLQLGRAECDGRPTELTVEDLDSHMAWVPSAPCRQAVVRYTLRPPKTELTWGYEFDVALTPDLFTAIAESALLLPDVPDDTPAHVEVEVDVAAMPKGTEGLYSLGPGRHDTTMRALRHAYVAAGRFATFRHAAGNLTLEARAPVSASLDLASASRDLSRFLDAEARLFADEHPETLRLLWIGMPAGGGAHGTSLTGSAMVWRDDGVAWTSDDVRLVAHEMFHLYNGQIIERSAGEGADAETYWFSEGVTEFYTDELLRRAGVTTAHQWLEALRDRLRRYHRHPDCETPNAKADMKWGGAAMQLPYLRGSLVAAYVDHLLKRRFAGARSLDDVMRALLARARGGAPPIEPDAVMSLLTRDLAPAEAGLVRSVLLDGRRLSVPTDTFGACVEVVGPANDQDLRVRASVDLEACMRAGG
jgi:predicted metalloprotease with PDZ domain